MTASGETAAVSAAPPKADPESLALRAQPRPVVRFRRGVIIGLTGAAAAGIVTVTWIALDPPSFRFAAGEQLTDEARPGNAAEALANAPASYGNVPRLGPPLPGDLGRPILERQRELDSAGMSGPVPIVRPDPAVDAAVAERQRRLAEREAARSSGLMVSLSGPGVRVPAPATGARTSPITESGADPGESGKGGGDAGSAGLRPAPSPWTLTAGTIIPAALVTGINSDLPGTIIAQVTEQVRDSATGRTVLVPQGAKLIGNYESSIAYGQRRALVAWQLLVFPDGSSIQLDKMPAADAAGFSGVADKVNFHTLRLIQGVALSTLLGVGTQLGLGGDRELVRAIREAAQQGAARAGDQITLRNLDVKPTLTVRPGWPVRAIVNQDLVLRPWKG